MYKIIIITIIESLYIYYMYNIYQTKISFHNPIEKIIQYNNIYDYLKHPIDTNKYESKICKFGKTVSIWIILWLFIRLIIKDYIIKINKIIFIMIMIISFMMNLNAFIYLIPIFIYEFFIFQKILKN